MGRRGGRTDGISIVTGVKGNGPGGRHSSCKRSVRPPHGCFLEAATSNLQGRVAKCRPLGDKGRGGVW